MQCSGMQDILEQIFAPNSVPHLLSGKAVSRAVRGHVLICTALYILLTNETAATSRETPEESTMRAIDYRRSKKK